MKRHLILLLSAAAAIAAAENVPHNMVSRHTPVNTNLIGAVVGEGLSLSNGVLSSTGGGGGGSLTTNDVKAIVAAATNGMVRKTGDTMTGPLTFNDGTAANPQSAFPVTVSGAADGNGTGGLRWNADGEFNGHFAPVAGLFWEFYFRNRWFQLPFSKGGVTNTAPAEIAVMKDLEDAGLTNALGSAAYRNVSEFATAADEALIYQLLTNRLSGVTFDFATVAGLYLTISNIVAAQGGAITNFPAIP